MNWFTKLFSRKEKLSKPTNPPVTYAFCENVAAGSSSLWHIRILTEKGKKLGGGADTLAMCGHVVHWDRELPVSRSLVFQLEKSICQKCSDIYMDATK